MEHLLWFALSTPVWGFALQPPVPASLAPDGEAARPALAQVVAPSLAPEDPFALEVVDPVGRRQTLMDASLGLQVATTVVSLTGAILASAHYGDNYGGHDEYMQTACARQQNAAMPDLCAGEAPWPQILAESVSSSLSLTTTILSAFVPRTESISSADASRQDRFRIFEATRWVGLGMHAVQLLAGILITNAVGFGWADQAKDFDTLNGLHAAHLAFSYATTAVDAMNAVLLF
jgi:hypothetical protein